MATEQEGHTSAPWECEPDLCHFDTLTTVVGGGHRKGYLGRELIVQVGGYAGAGEATANARLIAAAPDLLEAARRALNFIQNTEGEFGDNLPSGDALRAAIARATGEA